MERLSAADYVRAALEILAEDGSEALTIAQMCDRLVVTKGSFYHHFGGMPNFVSQLLDSYESADSKRLLAVSRTHGEPGARVASLIELAIGLPHGSEAAIRAWSRSNNEVAEAIDRIDRKRERYLVNAITALGVDRGRARVFARLLVNVLIGTQQREHPVEVKGLRQMFDEVTRLIELDADPRLAAALSAARAG